GPLESAADGTFAMSDVRLLAAAAARPREEAARGGEADGVGVAAPARAATGKAVTGQSVLQLLGAVEEEALFRLLDLVVDRDTAGALTFIEDLSEQGQDPGRLVTALLEHLRHLLLVQHMGEVPESLPVTEETRDRLREQA